MSWSSRFGGWAPSRWSPFTSRGDPSSGTVTDNDFSYITAEDLDNNQNYVERSPHNDDHHQRHTHQHEPRRTSNLHSSRTPRDTDIVILRHQRISYPVHFPAYSIDDGELTTGSIRDSAARKLNVLDARRIRMFYKGRILKDDRRACRDDGLHSDTSADILCVIGDRAGDRDAATAPDDRSDSEDDDDEDADSASNAARSTADTTGGDPAGAGKKKKRRSRKKKSKKPGDTTPVSGSGPPFAEHLPIPTSSHPAHRSGTASPATAASSRPQTPQTPRQKIGSIAAAFNDSLVPQCQAYIASPPSEPAKREFEHKKLSEMVLAQVLLKLDAVETEGDDEARAQRKALVKDAQGWLGRLDGVVKG